MSFKILEFMPFKLLDIADAFMLGQEYPEASFKNYGRNGIKVLVVYTGDWDEQYVVEHFDEHISDDTVLFLN